MLPTLTSCTTLKIPKVMEHASKTARTIAAAFALALLCAGGAAHAASKDGCVTQAELDDLQSHFFSGFPDANAFKKYTDKNDFRLLTNVASGRDLEQGGKPVDEKVDWIFTTLRDHKELFSNYAFDKPDLTYMKGQLRGAKSSVDNLSRAKRLAKKRMRPGSDLLHSTRRVRDVAATDQSVASIREGRASTFAARRRDVFCRLSGEIMTP
ncbi:hypothetical protein [Paraburkholderia bannensis]|uniref:hypothetical protein n=1 Tax=Paraburkholderia bannensis TaxID=765414 RepID=UPI001FE1C827|nr:hypothetical protein [Paraburkholderia bannensis]